MNTKIKYACIALAVASLAALDSGCAGKQTKVVQVAELSLQTIKACDLGYPPGPPPLFWESDAGCLGASMCSEAARVAVAQWIVDLAQWSIEAQECVSLVRQTVNATRALDDK